MATTTVTRDRTVRPHPHDERRPLPAPSPPIERRRRLSGMRLPLAAYAASRVLVVAVAAVVAAQAGRDPGRGPWPSLDDGGPSVLRVLGRWDSAWYLHIAQRGYPGADVLPRHLRDLAFFPLLPMVVRAVSDVTRLPVLVAGVLVATALGALAVVLVWRLVDALAGRPAADRAAVLLCVFPGAFAFSMVYSEPLLLVGAAGCLLALHRRAWTQAGLFGIVATAARPTGAVVVLACAWAAVAAVVRWREWRALQAPVVASLGIVAYLAYLRVHTGSWTSWLRSQHDGWHDTVDLGRATVERLRVVALDGPHLSMRPLQLNDLVGAMGLVFLVVAALLLWRWHPPAPVALYAAGAMAMVVVSAHVGPRPRMLLAAFPLVAAVGVTVKGKAFAAVVLASTLCLVALCAVTFVSKAATP